MPTLAAVDLGSNSFHLIVARFSKGKFERVARKRTIVRLRAGLGSDGIIRPKAVKRALDCLEEFGKILRRHEPRLVRVVATNSFRAARNGEELAQRGSELLGHPIEIIEGREEARLIYRALEDSFGAHDRPIVGVDIGGGSTELMRGEKGGGFKAGVSLEMGCISWSERHFPDGKLGEERLEAAINEAREVVFPHAAEFRIPRARYVGSSGTIRNVARIIRAAGGKKRRVTRTGLDEILGVIAATEKVKQLELDGMKERRAPIIAGGVAILEALFLELGIESMHYSLSALREGVLLELSEEL